MKLLLKNKILWIAALGYFVDLYDLVLYGVVRVQSLKDLHVPETEFFSVGANLLSDQMMGMLLGGLVWGILGDKKGRKTALFGSIFLYSLATLLNAFVQTVPQYAVVRFLAGFGLAGELGAAITLAIEVLPTTKRGLGAAMIASIGFMGAALASYLAQSISWQHAFLSGGILGIFLLLARMNFLESALYTSARQTSKTPWGSLKLLFSSKSRIVRFTLCFLMGLPIWYVAGILGYFSPELAKAFHVQGDISAGTVIMLGYLGSIIGDVLCGLLSQKLQSRKKAIFAFLLFGATTSILHVFWMENASTTSFYATRFAIGLSNGYMAVLIAWIAELFGTNLRVTATTLVSNLMRASVTPLIAALKFLIPIAGLLNASFYIGIFCFGWSLLAVSMLSETFHREINFEEV